MVILGLSFGLLLIFKIIIPITSWSDKKISHMFNRKN